MRAIAIIYYRYGWAFSILSIDTITTVLTIHSVTAIFTVLDKGTCCLSIWINHLESMRAIAIIYYRYGWAFSVLSIDTISTILTVHSVSAIFTVLDKGIGCLSIWINHLECMRAIAIIYYRYGWAFSILSIDTITTVLTIHSVTAIFTVLDKGTCCLSIWINHLESMRAIAIIYYRYGWAFSVLSIDTITTVLTIQSVTTILSVSNINDIN